MSNATASVAGPRPTVVVVDRAWQSFEQFAAALAQQGVDVVYVGVGLKAHSQRVRRVVFPGAVFLPDLDGLAAALADVRREHGGVADVLCNELDLATVLAAVREAGLDEAVVQQVAGRLPYADKVDAAAALDRLGLPTPRTLPAGTPAEDVARELGLPVVVKGRRGAGGLAVSFARDLDAVRAETVELARRTGDDVFYEEFVDGRNLNYACVYAHGRVVTEASFDTVRSHPDESRPPTDVVVIDDPQVRAIGQGLARSLPGVGIINLETMADGAGRMVAIDTNLRPFGSLTALARGGLDLPGAYARALRGEPGDTVTVRTSPPLAVFPTSGEALLDQAPVEAVTGYLRLLPGAVRQMGPRYGLLASLAFGTRTARTAAGRARTALRGVSAGAPKSRR